ncbi:MAG: selenoneine biosynthesis selenosugar synthase SenB [Vulcanimicrobiaceae bacterium]
MRIALLCPPRMGQRSGNAVTARRYARLFASLGHRVRLIDAYDGGNDDVLVALHAQKSAREALAYRRACPDGRLIVVMTGTDLYRDLPRSRLALRLLAQANAIVTLQSDGIGFLPREVRTKAVAIIQSATMHKASRRNSATSKKPWRFLVIGHLRREKDSLRPAQALRAISRSVCLKVVQVGGALDATHERRARAWAARDARYTWVGERSPAYVHKQMLAGDALIVPSRMEGGANVVCEAIAAGLPVLASRVSGNVGILGSSFSGYFTVADTDDCASVMKRFVEDASFRSQLRAEITALASLVRPSRERRLWRMVLK